MILSNESNKHGLLEPYCNSGKKYLRNEQNFRVFLKGTDLHRRCGRKKPKTLFKRAQYSVSRNLLQQRALGALYYIVS